MKFIPTLLGKGSGYADLSRQFQRHPVIRAFSTTPFMGMDDKENLNSSESVGDFVQHLSDPNSRAFYQQLGEAEMAKAMPGIGSMFNIRNKSDYMNSRYGSHNPLDGGKDLKFRQPPTYFEFDPNEVNKEDYTYRPDVNFSSGTTYDIKDLELRKPGVRRPAKRNEFETTTEEVLRSADFRNVRFLANFITEAGIIIKRSKTGISAKAQRKVAREIKTARAFGLMPFTTMGTKQFTYGKTMEAEDVDFQYEINEHNFVDNERGDPL